MSGTRFFAVYILANAVWAVAACWRRQPVLAVLAGYVLLDLALTFVRGSSFIGDVVYREDVARRIAPSLFDLCARAGCPPPTVVLRDDRLRGAAVRLSNGETQLLLSLPLAGRLSDRQLRAMVAHEITHLASGDLNRVRLRSVAGSFAGIAGPVSLGTAIGYRPEYTPLYAAAFFLTLSVVRFPLSLLNRRLERRADVDGAILAADPTALAEALTIADAFSTEARRAFASTYWRYVLFLSPWRWRLPTHPPIAERAARLEGLEIGPPESATITQTSTWPGVAGTDDWSTGPNHGVDSDRGAKFLLLSSAVAAVLIFFLVIGSQGSSHLPSGPTPSTVGLSTEASCFPPEAGIPISPYVYVRGGRPPYDVVWTIDGRPDTDAVSVFATTTPEGADAQKFTINVTPSSDDETMIVIITDANPLDSAEKLRVMGTRAECATLLPFANG